MYAHHNTKKEIQKELVENQLTGTIRKRNKRTEEQEAIAIQEQEAREVQEQDARAEQKEQEAREEVQEQDAQKELQEGGGARDRIEARDKRVSERNAGEWGGRPMMTWQWERVAFDDTCVSWNSGGTRL